MSPLIARDGDTVEDVCNKLHRDMRREFRYGLVWGSSVKFGGQRVGISHVLHDEDVPDHNKAGDDVSTIGW